MEGRKTYSVRNSATGQMSRVQQDLATSSRYLRLKEHNGETIQRIVPKERVPHICVVGAGISALKCAEVLGQNGIKVTIFEARNRIGGRVCGW